MNTESKQIAPLQEFRGTVEAMGSQFLAALPQHVPVEKFKRTVITAVTMQPDLLNCDRRSLLASCMKAASDGLLLDNRDAALVKFGQDVQYMPMVGGILKRMRQSGEIKSVTVEIMYENDHFERWVDETGDHLRHTPNYSGDRGHPRLAYCLIITKDGGIYIEVMDRPQIERVRAVSKTGRSEKGPWAQWEEEMWRKTVLRRAAKRAPMSTDVQDLIERGDEDIDFNQTAAATITPIPNRPRSLAALAPNATDPAPPSEPEAPQTNAQEAPKASGEAI